MNNQKGVIHLALPLLILLLVIAGVFALLYFGVIKNSFQNLKLPGQNVPKITVKSEYKNPFNKETQYVNPFQTYKNPFVVAK